MVKQTVLAASGDYRELRDWLKRNRVRHLLLVCDSSLPYLRIAEWFNSMPGQTGVALTRFSDFKPNPLYESVVAGVDAYRRYGCDAIMAVGGGSAMDVAKCIKLYSGMDASRSYLEQEIVPNAIPFIAMPTTAGTGSEATRFAVIYAHGEKQSVTHESCIPETVLLDASALKTLPPYQKKATMLDAFCHAVESFWSVNANEESQAYSVQAIRGILAAKDGYLANTDEGNAAMLQAANTAGKAINITQTTAGHAMCYKLTSLYGIAHGHAAALCVCRLWPYMLDHLDACADKRGPGYLRDMFGRLAEAMGCEKPRDAASLFCSIVASMAFAPLQGREEEISVLCHSVNPVRLKNNPVSLCEKALEDMYRDILMMKE